LLNWNNLYIHIFLDYRSTLKMEALCSSETLTSFYRSARRYIPKRWYSSAWKEVRVVASNFPWRRTNSMPVTFLNIRIPPKAGGIGCYCQPVSVDLWRNQGESHHISSFRGGNWDFLSDIWASCCGREEWTLSTRAASIGSSHDKEATRRFHTEHLSWYSPRIGAVAFRKMRISYVNKRLTAVNNFLDSAWSWLKRSPRSVGFYPKLPCKIRGG
jgi:hypothetical protein